MIHRTLAVVLVFSLAWGVSVAVAQPIANAGLDQSVAATYHSGQFVQLSGLSSTGADLTFEWEVLPESAWTEYDENLVDYYGFSGSLTTSGAEPVGFFPLGVTLVQLTVSQPSAEPEGEPSVSTDTVVITVNDERYRSLVAYNRPWARKLPGMADSILTDCNALLAVESTNPNFIKAQDAAEVAKTYEDFCQVMQFVYPYRDDYNTVVLTWYLPAREIQIQHHQGVAFHVLYGKGKSWSATETRTYNRALEAVKLGKTDLGYGTRSGGQPLY